MSTDAFPDISDAPAAKRQRTEGPTLKEITRSEIWYDDGSVVLQAESTQCRVHWTILAQHSPIFSDMRSIPQPPNQPLVEGCPIVQLSDSIEDVEHLLRALYNPLFQSTKIEFAAVAAIIRLGRKYEIKDLLTAMVARLTAYYSRTLDDHIESYSDHFCLLNGGISGSHTAFDVINLANANRLHALLPSLYFKTLSSLENQGYMEYVLTGAPRMDGTISELSFESQVIFTKSRNEIARTQANMMFGWLTSGHLPSSKCNDARCIPNRDRLTRQIFIPMYYIKEMDERSVFWDDYFCVECRKVTTSEFRQGSQSFWDHLPTFFDLPDWADLKNDI
ncbi:hypothetical protein C8R44DRAFT_662634 [Mycena epipterygia]|nr:hypothetical protein C8R44DRAFT_662634 [Mycena epipterygia]